MKIHIKILFIVLLTISSNLAQNNEWLVVQKDGPSLENYDYVKVVCDKSGGIWMLSNDIYHFENNNWEKHSPRLSPYEQYVDISLDSNDVLWICSNELLHSFSNNTWSSKALPKVNDYEYYGSILHDKNGVMWMSTRTSLLRLSEPLEVFNCDSLNCFHQMDFVYRDDTFYLGSTNDIKKFSDGEFIQYDFPGYKLGFDNEDNLWIAGWEKLLCLKNDSLYLISDRPEVGSPEVTDIVMNPDGGIYLATKNGFYSANESRITNISSEVNGLLNKYIHSLDIDNYGNVVLGTRAGLFKYTGNEFFNYNHDHLDQPIIASNTIQSIAHTTELGTLIGNKLGVTLYKDGSWTNLNSSGADFRAKNNYGIAIEDDHIGWILSGEKLVIYDLASNTANPFNDDKIYDSGALFNVEVDITGTKWITSEHGLFELKESGELNQQLPFQYNNMKIHPYAIYIEDPTLLWFVAGSFLLKLNDYNQEIYNLPSVQPYPYLELSDIKKDNENNLWLSSYTNGIGIWQNDTIVWKSKENSDIPSNYIHRMEFEQSNLWCVLDSGIAKYNGTQWHHFTMNNSELPSNQVNCLSIDQYGNKWIGTNNGLAIFNENGVTIEAPTNIERHNEVPREYSLKQNYPNPFSYYTKIEFTISRRENIKVILYDILGQEIKIIYEANLPAGDYAVPFYMDKLSSGVYIYSLQTESFSTSKKMVYLK